MIYRTLVKSAAVSSTALIAAITAAGSMTLFATPAMAQDTCDLNGTDAGTNAADANDGATATGTDALACGQAAAADQAGGVALGTGASAQGPSAANPIFASVAVGYNTLAHDNAVAIGNTAIARFSGTVNPLGTGINSAVAVGANAVAVGANTIAIGTTARAGTGFAFNTPGAAVNAGDNITVVGGRAEANQNDATAIGANSNVGAEFGTALGSNTVVTQAGGIAIGYQANAGGPGVNPIFASVAIGYNALAHDNATAIGNTAIARFSGTANPVNTGINSAVAQGAGAVAVGSNTIAIGTTARAGTGFAFDTPGAPVDAGSNITVVGGRAEANANGATAIGANSNVSGTDGTALGRNTLVTAANAVAIGNGSLADQDNTVSVGTVGGERRIVNLAAGTADTDAVNVSQLNAVAAAAAGGAAAAQLTADTALVNANTALAQNVVQDGRLTAVEGVNATQATQITAIQAVNTAQDTRMTAIEAVNTTQNGRLTTLEALVGGLGSTVALHRREGNGGIAAAMAMGGATIVPDSTVSLNFNLATYRGEQGFSGTIAARVAPMFYLTAGVAGSTVGGSTGGRVGVAIGF